jgi:two-component system response regulator TctD
MRVLLVEDSQQLADLVGKALGQSRFVVDCMHDGVSANHVLQTEDYDVVVLDLSLPRMDGWEVLKRLRARGNRVPVLILTAHGSVEDRVRGLDLGADDYLAKPFELRELEARIRALIRRTSGQEKPEVRFGSLLFDSASRTFSLRDAPLSLTPREHAVLEQLILRAGKNVRKDTLFEKVFGLDQSAAPDAIEIYIHRLRKKLEGSDVSIVTMRGLGYLLETRDAAA